MQTRLGPGGEFDLIRRFLSRQGELDPLCIPVGPGDDAAVVDAAPLAISTDMSVENVHFRRDWLTPQEIGWRAAVGALSDLAAMAAEPVGMLLSLAVPPADVPGFAEGVVEGVTAAARLLEAPLIGGDVARCDALAVLDLVVLGRARHPLRRSGARPGDELWVTGWLGGAAAAVRDLRAGRTPTDAARERLARPWPRLAHARWLGAVGALTAGIDLSDGIAGDARHLAAASGVGIVIDEDALPIDRDAGADLDLALTGGEDYELCVTARPGILSPLVDMFTAEFGLPLSRIGEVVEGEEVRLRAADGSTRPMPRGGYVHFGEIS